jgi:glycosyltransferase involved in cell wall biosynthesis
MNSICMTSFNGQNYIAAQLKSILSQMFENDELLISDDGSTDDTLNIIESFANKDSRIKLFKGPQKGLQQNFNFILSKASGDYIFLSDQDDVWLPQKMEVTLLALKGCNLVVSDCVVVDSQLKTVSNSFYQRNGLRKQFISNLYKNSFLGCCMAFDRKVLEAALPLPNNVPMHDWWIGLLSLVNFKVKFINEKLIYYRRHSANASPTSQKSTNSFWLRLKIRVVIFNLLLVRLFRKP